MGQEYVNEPARRVPVLLDCDVAVVGGGTAGFIAAIAAARQGANTVLIEKLGVLGGLLTAGMNTKPSGKIMGGIPLECWNRAASEGLAGQNIVLALDRKEGTKHIEISTPCDAEGMKFLAAKMCAEAGVRILFECMATAPVMDGGTVAGVVVECKGGRRAVRARVVVDCSADADIVAGAGGPFVLGNNGPMQPVSMFFKMNQVDMPVFAKWVIEHPEDAYERYIDEKNPAYGVWAAGFGNMLRRFQREKGVSLQRENVTLKTGLGATEIYCNCTRACNVSGLDPLASSEAILELYRQMELNAQFLRENVPGFGNSYINGVAPVLGVRESRHIVGGHTITEEEALGKGRFADSIGVDTCAVDFHQVDGPDVLFDTFPPYEIPYGALVPRGVEQIVVGGRTISATHQAHGRTRNIPPTMTTGQAAGFAAALAVKSGRTVRDIDVPALQAMIRAVGMPVFVSEL